MPILTADDLRVELGITDTTHTNNEMLALLVRDINSVVEMETGRSFGTVDSSAKTFDYECWRDGGQSIRFGGHRVTSVTAVSNTWRGTTITNYTLLPRNATYSYHGLRLNDPADFLVYDRDEIVSVTGTWTFADSVPGEVQMAARRIARWYWNSRKDGTDGDRAITVDGATFHPSEVPKDIVRLLRASRARI